MSTSSSTIFYLGTDANKILVVELDDTTGSLLKVIQEVSPVAPNPLQLKEGQYDGVATEWISRHPTFDVVYALTSYWNASEACLTTFRIDSNNSGALTELGSCSSCGFHAAHATFSPDGSLFVVAHHNDGKLVFFDSSRADMPLKQPCLILDTPELVAGTRRKTKRKDPFPGLPSLHHVQYAPNHKYLLTVDPSQDHIFTYTVDDRGLPTTQQPTSSFKCYSDHPIEGLFQRLITTHVLKCQRRARKAVVHPNGKYVYVVYESINRLQVYSIDQQGTITGVDGTNNRCWQDVSTMDTNSSSSLSFLCPINFVGVTLQLAAELYVSPDGSTLFVSNRGDEKLPGWCGSRSESSIRVFSLEQEGRVLQSMGTLPGVPGPVRHFVPFGDDSKMVAGVCQNTHQCLQTFAKKKGNSNNGGTKPTGKSTNSSIDYEYELIGEAHIGANVFCIAH